MIDTIIGYSHACFHLDNMSTVDHSVETSIENKTLSFLFKFMEKRVTKESLIKNLYQDKKNSVLSKEVTIFGNQKKFYVFKENDIDKVSETLRTQYNKKDSHIEASLIKDLPVFLHSNGNLYIMSRVEDLSDHIYLGKYFVFIE